MGTGGSLEQGLCGILGSGSVGAESSGSPWQLGSAEVAEDACGEMSEGGCEQFMEQLATSKDGVSCRAVRSPGKDQGWGSGDRSCSSSSSCHGDLAGMSGWAEVAVGGRSGEDGTDRLGGHGEGLGSYQTEAALRRPLLAAVQALAGPQPAATLGFHAQTVENLAQ